MALRTRSPNPLPEVDSRWIAHNRHGAIVVVDSVLFDKERHEERISYREEVTGYRGTTWRTSFRQRRLFTPAESLAVAVAPRAASASPIAVPIPSPVVPDPKGPPCSECGGPCQMSTQKSNAKTWRKTCSPACLAKLRSKLLEKATAAPRTGRVAPHAAASNIEGAGPKRPRSFQSSIRMTPEVKEALESIAAELSTVGPYPRPWTVAEVMALALDRFIQEHRARRPADVVDLAAHRDRARKAAEAKPSART